MKTKPEKAPLPDLYTDLRGITRDPKRCRTTVMIELKWDTKIEWLEFGQAQIRSQMDRPDGRWRLEGRITEGVTDFEHDSAYALRLPLIGLQLGSLTVHYHTTHFTAWVDPNAEEDLRATKWVRPHKTSKSRTVQDEGVSQGQPRGAHHRAGGLLRAPVR